VRLGGEAARTVGTATDEDEFQRVAVHCDWLHNGSTSRRCPTRIRTHLWKYARGKIFTCNFVILLPAEVKAQSGFQHYR